MSHVVRMLPCLGVLALSVAFADQPAAPAAPAPAAPAAAASTVAKPEIDPEEKRLIAMGYKPEMRNGQKVFCHTVEETGSRLGGKKECTSMADIKAREVNEREQMENLQRLKGTPSGR